VVAFFVKDLTQKASRKRFTQGAKEDAKLQNKPGKEKGARRKNLFAPSSWRLCAFA
jgi:hypothetical protein